MAETPDAPVAPFSPEEYELRLRRSLDATRLQLEEAELDGIEVVHLDGVEAERIAAPASYVRLLKRRIRRLEAALAAPEDDAPPPLQEPPAPPVYRNDAAISAAVQREREAPVSGLPPTGVVFLAPGDPILREIEDRLDALAEIGRERAAVGFCEHCSEEDADPSAETVVHFPGCPLGVDVYHTSAKAPVYYRPSDVL